MDLDKLKAAIDESERIARAATAGPWRVDDETYAEIIYGGTDDMTSVVSGGRWGGEASVFDQTADALHIAAQNPAVTLRMVAAHRKILDLHAPDEGCCAVCHGPEEMQEFYDRETEQETVEWISDPAPYPCDTVRALAEGYGIEA